MNPLPRAVLAAHLLVAAAAPMPGRAADEAGLPAWLAGHWRMQSGDTMVEEVWMAPAGEVMPGMARTLRPGRKAFIEYTRIESRADWLYFVAQPGGVPPTDFKRVESEVNADAGADQSICYGEIATFSASGVSNFSWSVGLGNQAIVNTQPLFISSSFIVTVTEGVCIDTDTINVTVTQVTATILASGDSVNFIQNNPIQLTAAGGDTFLWSHNLGQSNIVEVSPAETTIYSVTVTDHISGCSSVASINLIFNDLINKYIRITPNNDGLNETFIIPDLADFPNSAMVIYNRWGSIVWNKQPYENDWHGPNMMEQELPEGTYYYVIKLNNVDGDIRRGSITVKR